MCQGGFGRATFVGREIVVVRGVVMMRGIVVAGGLVRINETRSPITVPFSVLKTPYCLVYRSPTPQDGPMVSQDGEPASTVANSTSGTSRHTGSSATNTSRLPRYQG